MKAITVKQPWAWAIAHAGKTVENRGRRINYRGPLAIHAGLSWSERGAHFPLIQEAFARSVGYEGGLSPAPSERFPMGRIVAVADLVDAHTSDGRCCQPWGEDLYHRPDGFILPVAHWVLANVRPLPDPIPCRGRQILWAPPAEVTKTIHDQLAA